MKELTQHPGASEKLGFTVNQVDSASKFNVVRFEGKSFTKSEPPSALSNSGRIRK